MSHPAAYILPYSAIAAAFQLAKAQGPYNKKLIFYPSQGQRAQHGVLAASSGETTGYYGEVALHGKPKPVVVDINGHLGAFASMREVHGKTSWAVIVPEERQLFVVPLDTTMTAQEAPAAALAAIPNERSAYPNFVDMRDDIKLVNSLRHLARRTIIAPIPAAYAAQDMSAALAFMKAVGAQMLVSSAPNLITSQSPRAMARVMALPAMHTALGTAKTFG